MGLRRKRASVMFVAALAVAMCIQLLSARFAWADPQPAAVVENQEMTVDGVTFTVDFDLDAKTALVWDIKNPEAPTSVSIPASFEYDGASYTTTELQFSMWSKRNNVTGLALPNTLTSVQSSSFYKFPNLTEMTIPGSIKVFEGSFQNMDKLTTLTFEEGVEEIASNSMLNGCDALTTLNLPKSLKRITGPAAFADAIALESIALPEGVQITEGSLLSGCTSLKSVELPASVTEITSSMFSGCTKLEKVTAKSPVTSIGDNAFNECVALVEIPSLSEVTTIGEYAFNKCSSLPGPVDLSNVTKMGSYAFSECKKLSGPLDLSKLDKIPAHAFTYAEGISEITFSDALTSIGTWAFVWGGSGVLEFPETLTSIGSYAFYSSSGLSGSVEIPSSVTSVGKGAFQGTKIERFEVGSGLEDVLEGAFMSTGLNEIVFDNSQDNVSIADGAIPAGAKVTFKQPSIEDNVGDTISNDPGAPTLQKAVDEAARSGGIVTIEKHIKLTQPVAVPAGKTVVITSGEPFQIVGAKATERSLKNLFVVSEGASLAVGGGVTLSGRYNTGSAVLVYGAFELAGDAVVTASKLQNDQANTVPGTGVGVIDARGENASIKLTGGSITGNELVGNGMSYSGIVRVSNGATLEMTGGEISDNKAVNSAALNTSSGILLYGDATATISGGRISNNAGHRGSAVMLFGNDDKARTALELSGDAELSGNTCTSVGKVTGSGAVHVEDNAEFTMTGGSITGNKGVQGAGVCVVDGNLQRALPEYGTAFTMADGSISNNTGSTGGGVYSYSNGVDLRSGSIVDNTAHNMGGGVYSEGNYDFYSTLHLSNALIAENTARQGGGMWFCATGETTVYATEGAAIFDNVARDSGDQKAAGDDFVFSARKADGHPATLANRLLGGGAVAWYKDGGVYLPSTGVYPTTSDKTPRYGQEGASSDPVTVEGHVECLALKAVPISDEAKDLARAEAKLVITGNTADKGGGIGSNGGITIGREGVDTVAVSKVWKADAADMRPAFVTVELLRDGVVIDRSELTADGGWAHEFTGLPVADADGEPFEYAVAEVEVPGYKAEISGDADSGFVITNTKVKDPDKPVDPEGPGGTDKPGGSTDPEGPVDPDGPGGSTDVPGPGDGPADGNPGDGGPDADGGSGALPHTGDRGFGGVQLFAAACLGLGLVLAGRLARNGFRTR